VAERTLGAVIKEARERAALSQSALARASKVAANHISRIESGDRIEIGFVAVARIALALGLSLDEIAVQTGSWPGKGGRLEPALGSSTIVLEELRRANAALKTAVHRIEEAERVVAGQLACRRRVAQSRPLRRLSGAADHSLEGRAWYKNAPANFDRRDIATPARFVSASPRDP